MLPDQLRLAATPWGRTLGELIRVMFLEPVFRRVLMLIAVAWCGLIAWNIASAETPFSVTINSTSAQRYFSPNGDGQEDDVTGSYCLSESANVDITIIDAMGSAVRTVESGVSHPGGAGCQVVVYFTWDGKADTGSVAPDGAYTVRIRAVSAAGQTASGEIDTGIDARVPGRLTAPAPNDTLSGSVAWQFTPTPGFSLREAGIYCDGAWLGSSVTTFAGVGDTTYCTAGPNTLTAYARWTDPFGADHGWTAAGVPVTVNNPPRVSISQWSQRQYFSPNGDSQEDVANVYYCLSKGAKVTVTVIDSSGRIVRTFLAVDQSGIATCQGWNNYLAWDGRNDAGDVVADGVYTVRVGAVDSSDQTDEASAEVGIDNRTPGSLSEPEPNASLSGTVSWRFTPTAGFALVHVDVYCNGSFLGTSTAAQPDGTFGESGDSSDCDSGPNYLTAQAFWDDPFRIQHVWAAAPVPVTINNAPRLSIYQYYGHRYFSPNGDQQDDTDDVYYCLSKNATIEAVVTDSSGTPVRRIAAVSKVGGTHCQGWNNSLSWDGKNDAGEVVPDGVYSIRLRATDAAGQTADGAIEVGVDNRVPGTLVQPTPDSTLAGMVNWKFVPAHGFAVAEVQVACNYVSLGRSSTADSDGAFTGSGDSSGCVSGQNLLTAAVFWTDAFGSGHGWSMPPTSVTVNNAPRVSIYQYYAHRYFSPNGDGQEDTAEISYCLTKNAHVTVTITNADNVPVRTFDSTDQPGNINCYLTRSVSWDGKDDHGAPLPNGVYTVDVRAVDDGGLVAHDTTQVGVDSSRPGSLDTPHSGDTLAGFAKVAFQPEIPISRVTLSFDTGGVSTIYNASPDGQWRTNIYTGTLHSGPAVVHTYVDFTDAFGANHTWTAPDTPVIIDVSALPLTISAQPMTGPAPLSTVLRIDTSDPQARTVHYSAAFGDNSAAESGDVAAPYETVTLPHIYSGPGVYRAVVTVTNSAGAASTKVLDIAVSGAANTAPTASLALDDDAGVVPMPISATVSGSDAENDRLEFILDFGDGSPAVTGVLPNGSVAHTYTKAGTYLTRLSVSDGRLTSVKTEHVVVGLAEPLTANAGDDQVGTVNATVHFDGSASRPAAGIDSYHWAFGDGHDADGLIADHAYASPGTYTVTLTTIAANRSKQDDMVVVVNPAPSESGLLVSVADSNRNPLPGTELIVIDGAGRKYSATADQTGVGHLHGLPDGSYTVYGWKNGFLPGTTTAIVAHDTGSTSLNLKQGEVATASVTSTPMTLEEIVAAGINPNDPANQHVYEFSVNLAFTTDTSASRTTVQGFTASGGFPLCPTVTGVSVTCEGSHASFTQDDRHISVSTNYDHGQPQLVWLVMPIKASWLKEFFSVQMMVTNLADPAFTLDNGSATVQLPSGLTLAPIAAPQHATTAVPDIIGGTSATTTWLVRGDTEGFYTINASYAGSLEPFGDTVTINATTAKPLHVWGGSALELTVDAENAANEHYPFHVLVSLKNVADVPIYNATIEMAAGGQANYIHQPREQLIASTAALAPGASLGHDYILIPTFTGTLDIARSFLSKTSGDVELPSKIISHEPVSTPSSAPSITAINLNTKVALSWAPIPGASDYQIFSTPDPTTEFAAAPVPASNLTTLPDDHGTMRAVIRNIPEGSKAWYAVSPIINGHPLLSHPLVSPISAPASLTVQATSYSWPSNAVHSCGHTEGSITYTAKESFFDLADYVVTSNGNVLKQGTLTGHEASIDVAVDHLTANPREIKIQLRNSDNDSSTWTDQIDTTCERQPAVVIAMGLDSELKDGVKTAILTSPDCPGGGGNGDKFTDQAATNACDDIGDPTGSLIGHLKSRGFDPGETRDSPNRTLLEFSYNGATVNCNEHGAGPTFHPNSYTAGRTRSEIVTKVSVNSTDTADTYLPALAAYSNCWKQRYGRELTFTIIGHSLGGYEALALARRAAVWADQKTLISGILSVDGAIHPNVVIPEFNDRTCFDGLLQIPAELASVVNAVTPTVWIAHYFNYKDDERTAKAEIELVKDRLGIRVGTVTNYYDTCLHQDATINNAADDTDVFYVNYGDSGADRHSAALQAHGATVEEPGYPLAALIDSRYLPFGSSMLPPKRLGFTANTTAHIGGLLVDALGAPADAGQVSAVGVNGTVYKTVRTDGSFDVEVPPGDYKLFARPLGASATGSWVGGDSYATATIFHATSQVDVGDVSGTPLGHLTARLTTPDGQPIDGGAAVLVDHDGNEAAAGTTDANGNVTLTARRARGYTLATGSAGTTSNQRAIDLTDDVTATVQLTPGATASVSAKDKDGTPLVSVVAALYDGDRMIAAGTTNNDGGYVFTGLAPGDYVIRLFEGLNRFELPSVALPVTPVVGDEQAGTVKYIASSTPVITSSPPPTSTTVGSSYGFIFTADGSPAPTFSVANGQLPPGVSLDPTGSLHGTPSTAGTYTFAVRVSNNNGASVGGPYTIAVQGTAPTPTTTQLQTSASPSSYGTTVTFTATVTADHGTPTGTVTFTDDKTTLCADVPLNGSAICQTNSLSATGSPHVITASYSGATGFASSQGATPQLVTPATVYIDAKDTTTTYGTSAVLDYQLTGFVNNDNTRVVAGVANCQLIAGTPTGAGIRPNTIGCTPGTLTAPNYSFATGRRGTLTITKAPLQVTANDQNMIYGSTLPALSAQITGFAAGETLTTSGVTGTPKCVTSATSQSAAGPYIITCTAGSLAAGNYTFNDFRPGTLTVIRRPATLVNTSQLFVSAGSPTASAAPTVTLQAQLTPSPGGSPNLTKATVQFLLYKSDNVTMDPSAPDRRCVASAASNGSVTCNLSNVPADNWTILTTIPADNSYFSAAAADPVVLTVYQPSTGKFAIGAGWVIDPSYQNKPVAVSTTNKRGTFGLFVWYRSGTTPAGQAVYRFRGADGYFYVVKTTSWQDGGLSFGANTVSFTAKCDVIVLDATANTRVAGLGGHDFTCRIDGTDTSKDTYALRVTTPTGQLYHQAGTPTNQLPLQNGGLLVGTSSSRR